MKENKLIAEFMGFKQPHPEYPDTTYWYKELPNGRLETLAILNYHISWDWLMPVVEKIEDIENKEISTDIVKYHLYDVEIKQNVTTIHGTNIEETAGDKLFNTYHAVVEFIKQLNKQS